MALTDPTLPYGLRDVKLTPINSAGVLGTPVDLPVAQTFSFSEAEEFDELRGDDRLVAIHGKGPTVDFDIEAGGISIDAWKVLTGGTVAESGSTPNQIKSLTKNVADSRPYFQVEGQSINDTGGDTHVLVYKCKLTDTLEGEFADGTFFVTSCSGQGLGDDAGNLYTITWNETAVTMAAGLDEIQTIFSSATGGTFTITFDGQTTGNVDWDATTTEVLAALNALSNIDPGEVVVTGTAGAWQVQFTNGLGESNQPLMTLSVGSLTGGSAAAVTTRPGSAG